MSIRWDTRNKRWRYEFDRYIQGRRHRLSRLLPRGWSQAQADAYDRTEGARLYALASGIQRADPLIDEAVAHYLRDKKASLKSFKATPDFEDGARVMRGARLQGKAAAHHALEVPGMPCVGRIPPHSLSHLPWRGRLLP